MLVLTRKADEGIIIGDDISIKVIEIKAGAVRLGIEAPQSTRIYRQEVYDRIRAENVEATANWNLDDLESLSKELATRTVKK